MEAALLALMDAWREIESCVECSARTGLNALKTVRLARRAAIFPVAPLVRTRGSSSSPGAPAELSARCTRALVDVFRAHDVDGDGALSDVDVARMQRRGFGVAPAPGELDGLWRTCADATNGAGVITLDGDRTGLTPRGFLYAHGLFVAKGRAETTWTLLRAHGYDDDLEPMVDDDDDDGRRGGGWGRGGARGGARVSVQNAGGGRRRVPRRGGGARGRRRVRVPNDGREGRAAAWRVYHFRVHSLKRVH